MGKSSYLTKGFGMKSVGEKHCYSQTTTISPPCMPPPFKMMESSTIEGRVEEEDLSLTVLVTPPTIPAGMTGFRRNPLESAGMRPESAGMQINSTGMQSTCSTNHCGTTGSIQDCHAS